MNAHIPDQLDQLSKKDLVEVAKIMHETNVDLNAQLAKANEREKDFIAYIHDAQKWFDKHDPNGYLQISHPKAIKALNKFAIEKKIEALENLAYGTSYDVVSDACNWEIEQLRKGQE